MQKTEQGELALLDVGKSDPFSQLCSHLLGAAHMMLCITVTFLKRPDQGIEHF